MYDRFFAFGCSHTYYFWPSWADIIADDLELPYYNYAQPGMGNVAIMHEIVAADLKHSFTDNDLIIVMWTHWSREDRYFNTGWNPQGSVFNSPFYNKKFIRKYWSYANDIVKNATAIISVNKMFKEKIAYQCHIIGVGLPEREDEIGSLSDTERNLINQYYPYLPVAPVLDNHAPYSFDGHPDIKSHLNFVTRDMYPKIGLKVKNQIAKKYLSYHRQMQQIKSVDKIPSFDIPTNLAR